MLQIIASNMWGGVLAGGCQRLLPTRGDQDWAKGRPEGSQSQPIGRGKGNRYQADRLMLMLSEARSLDLRLALLYQD